MEGKKYSTAEEDSYGSMTASEPMVAHALSDNMNSDVTLSGDEELLQDCESLSLGPSTSAQAARRLKEAERQFATGKWITGDVFFAKSRQMIDSYAS